MSKLIERRRANAKVYLEEQLAKGTKPEKVNGKTTSTMIPLTAVDKTRIQKDIIILSSPRPKKVKKTS